MAEFDDAAVDHVRSEHLEANLPLEGGDFTVEVSSPDEATVMTNKGPQVRPPGVISRFGVRHEPDPSVAEEVRAKRQAEAEATEKADAERKLRHETIDSLVAKGLLTREAAKLAKGSEK